MLPAILLALAVAVASSVSGGGPAATDSVSGGGPAQAPMSTAASGPVDSPTSGGPV